MSGASTAIREQLGGNVNKLADRMTVLARELYEHPELCFAEHLSVAAIRACLVEHGVTAQVGVYGLPTAFRAACGSGGGPRVALLAEYDALPEIGHGCGHNLIAAASVAAFLSLAPVIDQLGGTVELIGTPAEEGGGGKEFIINAGGFDGIDAALMVHPSHEDQAYTWHTGRRMLTVSYRGRAAHAAIAAHLGRNALDAVVTAYQSIALLRRHIPPGDTVAGIITDGGVAPSIVPETAAARFLVRSATFDGLRELSERVEAVVRAAASATGTEVEIEWDGSPAYLPTRVNAVLAERFIAGGDDQRLFPSAVASTVVCPASTDLGNVSNLVPAIQPHIALGPPDMRVHTREFALWTVQDAGRRLIVDGAIRLARTAADFLADPRLRESAAQEFQHAGGARRWAS